MNHEFPVFTIENECQDCYKCVRHCPCKAIRVVGGHAAVIPERCVACGECVKVCPARAKKVRSDMARLKQLLLSGAKIYASVAPSFPGYFPGVSIGQLASTLMRLGFAGVSETAHGAQLVSAATGRFLAAAPAGVYFSSACPAAVDYLRKYHPECVSGIVPVDSPVVAHCKLLRKEYGSDIATVFIGPCAAKKNEADRLPETLNLAITFASLEQLLSERELVLAAFRGEEAELALGPAAEGRSYSLEGGMNDTLRDPASGVRYAAVSGLANLERLLESFDRTRVTGKYFIEVLACAGGCVNGPVMRRGSAALDVLIATEKSAASGTSLHRDVPVDIRQSYFGAPAAPDAVAEAAIMKALASVGKTTRADELNCGACGYDSCRDFARALIEGKAETAMCHTYLRRNFQRTSNALIKYIPAGVVFVNEDLQIVESNRKFAELIDADTVSVYDTLGNLDSVKIDELVDFADLFESVIANGGEIEKFNQSFRDRILNISVFSITQGKVAGAVIQDVTCSELQREQVAEKAREIIRKNVQTVQQVARIFGEHIADSEILLNEIAGTYSAPKEPSHEQ